MAGPANPFPSPGAGKGIGDMLKSAGAGAMNLHQKASDRGLYDNLAMGFNSMRLSPDPMLAQSINRRMMERRTNQQQAQTANKTADFLEAQGKKEMADMVRQNPALGSQMLLNYQKAQLDAAAAPQFTQFVGEDGKLYNYDLKSKKVTSAGSGGVNINNQGSIPPGYELVTDPETNTQSMRPIEGSPAWMQQRENLNKAEEMRQTRASAASTVVQDVARAMDVVPNFTVNTGNSVADATGRVALSNVPGTPEYMYKNYIESAASNIGIDTLMNLKINSGAGLGAVPFQQQKRLEQVFGSMEIGQPTEVLEANGARLQNIYLDVMYGTYPERVKALEEGEITQEQFDNWNSKYKPVPFDSTGRPWDTSRPPKSWKPEVHGNWDELPDNVKQSVWARLAYLYEYEDI